MQDLWRAVGAQPEDDELRLVVADAFEERGDPMRAELIRVQVAQRQADLYEAAGMDLRWRERVLLARGIPRWRAELPRGEGAVLDGWDRGFPAWVHARDPEALLAALPELPPTVTGLRLSALGAPGELSRLPPFRRLSLKPHTCDGRLAELLGSPLIHPGLQELGLAEQALGDEDLERLARAGALQGLTSLDLRKNYLTEGGLASLVRSPHLRGLRVLLLGRSLLSLGYERMQIGAGAVGALLAWEAFPRLEQLDLAGQGIDVDAAQQLLSCGGALRVLDLSEAGLRGLQVAGDGGMRLQRLVLRDAELRNEDLRALLSSPAVSELRALDLSRNPLGRGVADLLAEAPCWSEGPLRELVLEGAPLQRATPPWARTATGPLSLQLSKCGLDGGDLDTLARAPWWGGLRELSLLVNPLLAHAPGVPMGASASAVAAATHLRRLALGPDDGSWHTLPAGLVELRLSAIPPALVGSELPELVSLDLSRSRLGEGLAELARAPWLPDLIELDLDACGLRPGALSALLSGAPSQLQVLRISSNRMGERDLAELVDSPHLQGLVELVLDGRRDSEATLRLLEPGRFPWLRRLRWGGESVPIPRERELARRYGWE
jgi:uncharacterized protein (TIGR02996 family)